MRAGHVDMRAKYCCHFTVRDHYLPPMPVLMWPTSSRQYCAYGCITGLYVFLSSLHDIVQRYDFHYHYTFFVVQTAR